VRESACCKSSMERSVIAKVYASSTKTALCARSIRQANPWEEATVLTPGTAKCL
jgi:hypothetical protein